MFLARRASSPQAHDFPVGTLIIARPATVGHPINGVVLSVDNKYTVVVDTGRAAIAVDVEDCEAVWQAPSARHAKISSAAGQVERGYGAAGPS